MRLEKEIKFTEGSPIDVASAKLAFITNRMSIFNRQKYKRIVVQKLDEDNKVHRMFFHVLFILAITDPNVQIVCGKEVVKYGWFTLSEISTVKPVANWRRKSLLKRKTSLSFSLATIENTAEETSDKPQIFSGFSQATLEEISDILFHEEVE